MAKTVFEKREAQDMAVAYVPRKFPRVVSEQAKAFVSLAARGGGAGTFKIDRIVSEQTGIADMERLSLSEKVEKEALERVAQLQETAYKEAFQLGFEEGRRGAHDDASEKIEARLAQLDALLSAMERLKQDLAIGNEAHLVRLAYAIASKIAMDEIRERPDLVAGIVRRAIEEGQADERIVVRVSAEDKAFIEASRERLGRDADAAKRVKLEEDASVASGGCVIETNFGSIDATIEQRVQKLWQAIAEKLPKTPDAPPAPAAPPSASAPPAPPEQGGPA
jgi:flagellar assembly protein FliH